MKKLLCVLLAIAMLLSVSVTAFAGETTELEELETAYNNVLSYASQRGIELDMTFEDFLASYNGESVEEYEQSFYDVFEDTPLPSNSSLSSSSSGKRSYYYETDESCPEEVSYSKYNLLEVVQKGDIIFESAGGLGITGHIAIVEGVFFSDDGRKYIRLIEAIDVGVIRSILDDKRVDDKGSKIMRVFGATDEQINNAVNFCINELGSSYKLDFAKDYSANETDWYCSELVWAAYYNQGYDLEINFYGWRGEPGITPRDVRDAELTRYVEFTTVN